MAFGAVVKMREKHLVGQLAWAKRSGRLLDGVRK